MEIKRDILKKQYSKTFDFIKKDILRTYFICLCIFVCIMVLTTYLTYYMLGEDGIKSLLEGVNGTAKNEKVDMSLKKTWYDYFMHNGFANLLVIISGFVPFLFIPVIIMVFNAVINGFAIGAFALVYDVSFMKSFLVGIAPHGVFEYAVNLLGFALGVTLCKQMILGVKNKNIKNAIPYYIKNSLRVYILVILPGLLIAGIIESTISPWLLKLIS